MLSTYLLWLGDKIFRPAMSCWYLYGIPITNAARQLVAARSIPAQRTHQTRKNKEPQAKRKGSAQFSSATHIARSRNGPVSTFCGWSPTGHSFQRPGLLVSLPYVRYLLPSRSVSTPRDDEKIFFFSSLPIHGPVFLISNFFSHFSFFFFSSPSSWWPVFEIAPFPIKGPLKIKMRKKRKKKHRRRIAGVATGRSATLGRMETRVLLYYGIFPRFTFLYLEYYSTQYFVCRGGARGAIVPPTDRIDPLGLVWRRLLIKLHQHICHNYLDQCPIREKKTERQMRSGWGVPPGALVPLYCSFVCFFFRASPCWCQQGKKKMVY